MLATLALALVSTQITVDEPFVWDLVETPGFVPGASAEVIGTVLRNQIVYRVGDQLRRHRPDGTLSFSASVAGAQALAVLDDGEYATARAIGASDPGFPAAPGTGGIDMGVTFFDALGSELWRARVGGLNDESRIRLVPDRLGSVYVLTESVDPNLGPPFANGVRQLAITRLDGGGGALWNVVQEVTFPDFSAALTSAVAHPVHGLVLSSTETSPLDPNPNSFLTRYLPSGQRVFRVPARPLGQGIVIDTQGNVFSDYSLFDIASSVKFSGLISYGPSGAERWSAGHCDASVGVIDGGGRLWALSEEVVGGGPCTFFEVPEVRRLLRIDRANGQIVERIDVPAVVEGAPFANLTMTAGEHVHVRGGSGGVPFLARLSRTLDASTATCPGVVNSTGVAGLLLATGAEDRAEDDLTLFASSLPASVTTLFVTGFADGLVVGPGGSEGNLCLSGPLGRFNASGELRTASSSGAVAFAVDLDRIPTPGARVALSPGQTVYFQAWYRDATPMATSNFTSAIAVTLN